MKSDFIIALTQLAAERNLPRDVVLSAIEDALVSAYKKDSVAAGQDISVKLDPGSGDVSVFLIKTVAEEVTDPLLEMDLEEAKKIKPGAEIGDIVPTEELPHSAGRIAAQTAKQVVVQRLREAEREIVFQEYADKEGDVFTVTVQKMEPKQITVELGRAEAVLPPSEQVPYERYRVGHKLKVLLQSIRRSNKGPEIIVSRADELLVKRLFEMEVPEIYNGSVEIVSIAREPGSRSKVAVWAKQDGVDAVGSCVGLRGIRIQNIVNELYGEKIDVVKYDKDPVAFIASSLSPSPVMRVDLNPETGTAVAVVPDRQLSLAIGKEGQNARLAARLTGWNVDIRSTVEAEAAASAAAVAAAEAPAPVEAVEEPSAEPVTAEEAVEVVAAEEIVEQPVAEEVLEAVPAEPEVAEVTEPDAPAEQEEPELVEPDAVEISPEDLFMPEVQEPEPVPVLDAASLHDLPEDVWAVRGGQSQEAGVIRFAEDIDELQRGQGGGRRRRGGGGGRGRRTRAPRRR
jgi:N utilization substance protein A